MLENSFGSNGELVPDIADLLACRAECMSRGDECFGVDWDWTQFRLTAAVAAFCCFWGWRDIC